MDDSFEVVLDLSAASIALSGASTGPLVLTADSLITGALKLLGVIAGTETPSADQGADGLQRLNEMLDMWQTQGLLIPSISRNVYPLTTAASYTIGPGGTFNQQWPETIVRAGLIYTSGTASLEIPLRLATVDGFANEVMKAVTSPFPGVIYYDHAYVNGLGTITVWPVPTGTFSLQIALYTPATLIQFASLHTAYTFPPGYAKTLRYNLARDLAPEYGKAADPTLVAVALDSLANIKRANSRLMDLQLDPSVLSGRGGVYNIFSDTNG